MEDIIITYSFDELSKESQQRALNKYRFYFVKDGKWYSHCQDQWHKRGVNFELAKSIDKENDHHDPSRGRLFNFHIDANTSLEDVAISLRRDFSKKKEIHQKAKDYLHIKYDMRWIPELNFTKESLMTEIYKCILEQLQSEWHYLCSDESLMNTFEHDEWVFNRWGVREVVSQVYEVDSKRFLDWYFFNNDTENLVHGIVDDIFEKGKACITVQEIFEYCEYVPISLVLDNLTKEDAQFGKQLKVNKDVFLKLKEDDKN